MRLPSILRTVFLDLWALFSTWQIEQSPETPLQGHEERATLFFIEIPILKWKRTYNGYSVGAQGETSLREKVYALSDLN